MEEKIKVILDTDIGDDVDDAFALVNLVKSNKFELLGITTVYKDPLGRIKVLMPLLHSLNVSVPVCPGEKDPFKRFKEDELATYERHIMHQKNRVKLQKNCSLISKTPQKSVIFEKNAVEFIIDTVHKFPNEITIILIGPYTNLAQAIYRDESIIPLIKEVRIMGTGKNLAPNYERNTKCDVEAAKFLFNSGVKLSVVPANISRKAIIDEKILEELKTKEDETSKKLSKMVNLQKLVHKDRKIIMSDPLVVCSFIENFIEFNEEFLDIDEKNGGEVIFDEEKRNRISYGQKADLEKFWALFKTLL